MVPKLGLTRGLSSGLVERTLASLLARSEHSLFAEELALKPGLLQGLDPRVKLIGLFGLIVDITFARNLFTILLVFAIGIGLAVLSRVPIAALAKRAWIPALLFTGVIAIPVIFITPGEAVGRVPFLNLEVSQRGVASALYLISRVEVTATLSLLLVFCTRWTHILKALRVLFVPVVFVVILGMTYRYIFVILEMARNMLLARRSRLMGKMNGRQARQLAVGNIGVLLAKSFQLNTDVYMAMQSRGFRGEVYIIDDFVMKGSDWLALSLFALSAAAVYWLGRMDSFQSFLNWQF